MTRSELNRRFGDSGVADAQVKMRTTQLWNWIYARGAQDFGDITNVSKSLSISS